MSQTKQVAIGFFDLLTILFIALKLTDVIDWSWWWVLSPLWIPFALAILSVVAYCLACAIDPQTKR